MTSSSISLSAGLASTTLTPESMTTQPITSGTPLPEESDLGNCRTCLKRIKLEEEYHFCDNCTQIVCEDCSSYSGKNEGKVITKIDFA